MPHPISAVIRGGFLNDKETYFGANHVYYIELHSAEITAERLQLAHSSS